MRDLHTWLGALSLAVGLAVGSACAPEPPSRAETDWPPGALLSADRAALAALLDDLEPLAATPLGRLAGELRRTLPHCDAVEAMADRWEAFATTLRCAAPDGALAGLHRHRGEHALALVLPRDQGSRPVLLARAEPDAVRVSLDWPREDDGALASLQPGDAPAGPAVLAATERVLHLRVRSEALDPAAWVAEDGQGDRLFRLRNALLSKALLDDTWELALYPPAGEERMPRAAVALGLRSREAGVAALDRFVADWEAAWSLEREPLPGAGTGWCLPELRVLPDLSPCARVTDRALVLGWNAASLEQALATRDATPEDDAPARFALDLERLQHTDRLLAAALGGEAPGPVTVWPWQRIDARGERRDDAVRWSILLMRRDS